MNTHLGRRLTKIISESMWCCKESTILRLKGHIYLTMTIANICLCFINDADQAIEAAHNGAKREHAHQANRRQCVGQIVPKFLGSILTDSERKRNRLLKEVEQFCERFSEPIRPDRHRNRKMPRTKSTMLMLVSRA